MEDKNRQKVKMGSDRQKIIEGILEKKEEVDRAAKREWLEKIKIHWWLVIIAILITFIVSVTSGVSIYGAFERCFYAGAAFWVISEIIDMIFKGK